MKWTPGGYVIVDIDCIADSHLPRELAHDEGGRGGSALKVSVRRTTEMTAGFEPLLEGTGSARRVRMSFQ